MFLRLRWLSIVVPVLIVVAIEIVSDTLLDADLPFPVDAVLIGLVVLATAASLSWLAFREIGRLTRALEARNAELAVRTETARALHAVAVDVAGAADLGTTLRAIVERAQGLLRSDVAVLLADVPGLPAVHLVHPAGAWMPDVAIGEPELDDALRLAGFDAQVTCPIRAGRTISGIVAVGARGARSFGVDDVETLNALASMAAVAIRNHAAKGSLHELAVRGERERIAREMHDGLAQVLAYVSAKSAAADQLVAAGNLPGARRQMSDLGDVARSTYVDVRESILGLATPVSPEDGLVAAIEAYGRLFTDSAKLPVAVVAGPGARDAELAPEAEAQAFRIVQEALTNVRKHAHASRARIVVEIRDGQLSVAIDDDGLGMSADIGGPSDWPHYGLATMSARAAEAGGTITWSPGTSGGTRVELLLPVGSAAPGPQARRQGVA